METVYNDYSKKNVTFHYIYKTLAHPERDGYLNPFTLEERLLQIQEAKRVLGTKIPWICDTMDNRLKHAFGNRNSSEFIIDPDGRLSVKRAWSDPEALRKDLERLVGAVENPTRTADLDTEAATRGPAPTGVVPRLSLPVTTSAIVVVPKPSDEPFYVKLRAEADQAALDGKAGKLYLGFHLDPLHKVHWNNLADPIHFEIEAPAGVTVSPASANGPKVATETDGDPREFLLDIDNGQSKLLVVTARYFACSDTEGWCKPVTQRYEIRLERDRDAGSVRSRNGMPGAQAGRRGGGGGMAARLMNRDQNGDGKISRDEAPERMLQRFDMMDANADGFIDSDEIERFFARMGRR